MNKEVLNVDDDKMVLFIHEKMMMHAQFSQDPKAFPDANSTLDYIKNQKAEDKKFIIFLDVNMPKLDGWGFMDILEQRNLTAYCHIFMVSSSIDQLDKEKAETYPVVVGFVEKPLSIEKLQELKKTKTLQPFFT